MRNAKITAFFFAIILLGALLVYIFGNSLASHAVRYSLMKSLPQYKTAIKSVRIKHDSVVIYGAQAKNKYASLVAPESRVSFKFADLMRGKISRIEVNRMTAEIRDISIKNINMSFDEVGRGRVSVETVEFQKVVISDIEGPFDLEGNILKVEPIHGAALDGTMEGRFQMRLDGDKEYELHLTLQQLSLPALISDLKFEDKMSMTGRFLGKISIHGNKLGVASIDGTLNVSSQGGDLVILDERFLGDIATRMKQPLELVKAGLKEYHYNTGQARLFKNGHDLGLDLSLDGPKGKRQLSTVFHDTI